MNKPKAILVDLDGTVAKKTARSYYEWEKLDTDVTIDPVVNLVRNYPHKIIILTARNKGYPVTNKTRKKFPEWSDEKIQTCGEKLTVQWVWLNIGDVEKIVMKPAGSYENSADFKLDKYYELCEDYDIEAIIDDNQEVCNLFSQETNIQVIQIR